jgi:hypothetical protein
MPWSVFLGGILSTPRGEYECGGGGGGGFSPVASTLGVRGTAHRVSVWPQLSDWEVTKSSNPVSTQATSWLSNGRLVWPYLPFLVWCQARPAKQSDLSLWPLFFALDQMECSSSKLMYYLLKTNKKVHVFSPTLLFDYNYRSITLNNRYFIVKTRMLAGHLWPYLQS